MNKNIENFNIIKSSGFDGFEIDFAVNGQSFVFLASNTKQPFPLGVRHQFTNRGNCSLCSKVIYPAPIGQQPCPYFEYSAQLELLEYFKPFFPN